MHEPHDRRTAVRRLAAGMAAAVAVPALASGAEAADAAGKSGHKPVELFRGDLADPVYTPLGEEGTARYLIVADGCSGKLRDCRHHDSRHMSSSRFFRYLHTKSGGEFGGRQTFRLEGINWRLERLDHDDATGQWRIEATVCDSNPDLRPTAGPSESRGIGGVEGCNCGCDNRCYVCPDGRYRCGETYTLTCLS